MRNVKIWGSWAALVSSALVLSACGGGGGDDGSPGNVGAQQYPGGFWEGTVGVGTAQRQVFGYIDPGMDGTGGEFFISRGAPTVSGFDAMYGTIKASGINLAASGVSYYSVADQKTATTVAIRGTVTPNAQTGRASTIAAAQTDPAGTAASTGGVNALLQLKFSSVNSYAATLSRIAGSYRGGSFFGGGWVLNVTSTGTVSGTIGNCRVVGGSMVPQNSPVGAYRVTLPISGEALQCPESGSTQMGIATLKYSASGVPTNIWLMSRGHASVFVLNGIADPKSDTSVPSAQSTKGNWTGTGIDTTGQGNTWSGTVLKNGAFFFYAPSADKFLVHYGRLVDNANNSTFASTYGVAFDPSNWVAGSAAPAPYFGDLTYEGNVGIGAKALTVTHYQYSYLNSSFKTGAINYTTDSVYPNALPVSTGSISMLDGTYVSDLAGYGPVNMRLVIANGVISGETTDGCSVHGAVVQDDLGQNNFRVTSLGYEQAVAIPPAVARACPRAGAVTESGSASARVDAGVVTGLRVLTAALQPNANHTVFFGKKQP